MAPSRRPDKRRSGAVLVEAVIASTALCSVFGCVLLIHLYCSLQLSKLDEAREEVWNTSMPGCGSEDTFDVRGLVSELRSGTEPGPPEWAIPSERHAARSFSARGIFNVAGQREIRFVCNPRPTQKTMNETVQWVLDIFL
jgi:hypothetical protein